MKYSPLSLLALIVSCGTAMAQDEWAGGYAGAALVLGDAAVMARGDLATQLAEVGISDRLFAPEGRGIALRIGRDWQHGQLVLGIAAEYRTGKARARAEDARIGAILMEPSVLLSDGRRVSGRIGYAAGDWLPYAVAGHEVVRFAMTGGAPAQGDIQGSSLGLGVEHRMSTQLSTFAEYAQTQFDPIPGAGDQLQITRKDLRLGANFRF